MQLGRNPHKHNNINTKYTYKNTKQPNKNIPNKKQNNKNPQQNPPNSHAKIVNLSSHTEADTAKNVKLAFNAMIIIVSG